MAHEHSQRFAMPSGAVGHGSRLLRDPTSSVDPIKAFYILKLCNDSRHLLNLQSAPNSSPNLVPGAGAYANYLHDRHSAAGSKG